MRCLRLLFSIGLLTGTMLAQAAGSNEPGLLFYLSGDHGFTADYAAGGRPSPNFLKDVKILPGGAKGSYLQCGDNQLLSYWAPGNIYSQRGTLSFFWRSREPVGKTEFPIFRVGYGDHSSWDMVWLRIDYNGHGFDAFVTDINLGRTRVSYTMPDFPKPDQWVHLALAWDETSGIRFYVNGKLAATKAATGMFDAALDQFGPHSRLIAPTGVESSYNFDRGGDIDELRIYDRMLSDDNIASLAKNEVPQTIPPVTRTLAEKDWQQEWWFHYGWNRPGDIPTPLESPNMMVRKVEIHDAYDLKRWWWKATDGIRETTWPGVYNRSRLVGRNDYFQLPDWDCYSLSGKAITFFMPNEPWNHLEISGGAWGNMSLLSQNQEMRSVAEKTLFERPQGQEKTFHQFDAPVIGEKLRFTNVEQETPIGELSAYYVHPGKEPAGIAVLKYKLTAKVETDNPSLKPLLTFIDGRFPPDERMNVLAMPAGAPATTRTAPQNGLPIVHVLIPADFRDMPPDRGHAYSYGWENMGGGLDGIAIDLPALKVKPTHGEYVPLNIQVKDPLWPMRDMLDFSFSVKPGEPHTLWLDTRDRILPNGKSLYITIASASGEFGPAALEGAELRLIFKPWKDAKTEHVSDRFTQVRDNYANMVEESVGSRRLNLFNRYDGDITDLLRVDPENIQGRIYWHEMNREQDKPPFILPIAPPGVPTWAFLQVEDLGYLKRLVNWYIDNRQIENGEFGGGLSDDSDFLNWWPGAAFMGATPDKIKASLLKTMDAMYDQHMFTNGLATIQADELHSYEDGLNVLGQSMQIDFGSPKQIERAMETARRLEWLTGINSAGHRHIRSAYFNGAKISEEGVWGWSKDSSYMVFHPALQLVLFNGAPETRKIVLELADGLLAHRKLDKDGKYVVRTTINFKTDEDLPAGMERPWFILWAAYRWTGDKKYIQPFLDQGAASLQSINSDAMDMLDVRKEWGKQVVASAERPAATETPLHLAWQVSGDTGYLEKAYASQIETAADRQFLNTEGSLWIDRIYFNNGELQRARLGGVALMRNYDYPGNVVSWRFEGPANDQSVAVLIPEATPDHFKVIAYNLDSVPVKAKMTGWEIDPGKWQIMQGVQSSSGNDPLRDVSTRTEEFERSRDVEITFPPHTTTVVELKLVEKGVPYWSRPDLGIGADDVKMEGGRMKVTVHSLGSVDAPASKVVLRDKEGKVLASRAVPAIKAPLDLFPKTATVMLAVPSGANWKGGSVTVESSGDVPEITQLNNRVPM
jgi:Concanavalin A-like lectin/glucanases superfamily